MADPSIADRKQRATLVPIADSPRPSAPLPVPLTSFVGRESEIAAVTNLLRQEGVRLVTLTGPGGVGKTRLALAVLRGITPAFADEAIFVELAPVRDSELVGSAIVQAAGLRALGGRPVADLLISHFRDRHLVLVLDNLEHLLAAAPLAVDLLTACPNLTILTTSRTVLRVSGEHAVDVRPLIVPAPGSDIDEIAATEAVRLFVSRAQAAQATFTLDEANAPAVAAIVRQLDGLPLAIELAAARIKLLSPDALEARLERSLPLLTGGARDAPARLRTMRGAVAWSYDLLAPDDQVFFRRLAVFVGGFTQDAAAAVAHSPPSSILERLGNLVDHSLIRRVPESPGEPRYVMLETIREFAHERLIASGEEATIRKKHADWCLTAAEEGFRTIIRARWHDARLVERLDGDRDNYRSAIAWLLDVDDRTKALRLAAALRPLWFYRHVAEGRHWIELALARAESPPAEVKAAALGALAPLMQQLGQTERSVECLEEVLRLRPELEDDWIHADALFTLGWLRRGVGDFARAEVLFLESAAIFRDLDARGWVTYSYCQLASVALGLGDVVRARHVLSDALERAHQEDFSFASAQVHNILASIEIDAGEFMSAARALQYSLPIWREFRDPFQLAVWLGRTATLAVAAGRPMTASRWFGATKAWQDKHGAPFGQPERTQYERGIDVARKTLGEARFATEFDAGRLLTLEQAIDEASAMVADLVVPSHGTAGSSVPGSQRLTARELDVLRLVAQGATNREIADELFISVPTVKRHLTTVFAKLGVSSREAAAITAHSRGLD